VAEAMREADLFVLPSLYENLPCSLIEAAASGLPSVATAVGGVPTLIDPTRGVLCPPGDAAALAAAIRAALQRREQFDPGALAAGAQERFGYLAIATRWSTVYREVLARRN
jgi:glycogen(starch) synthase